MIIIPSLTSFSWGGDHRRPLELNSKRAIGMGTRLALNIHERGDEYVKPGRHVFIPKFGTEERIMDFLKRYVGGKK